MKSIIYITARLLILVAAHTCYGQGLVLWKFNTTPVAGNEATLLINATLAPGWHLYSQRMKEGGPMPTRFSFDSGPDCIPVGVTEERGMETVFYDDVHEMEVAWYYGTVYFSQEFSLSNPQVTIKGKVEYMICNDHVCIPGEQKFSIGTSHKRK